MKIDLNCDMGEGFGRYPLGDEQAIMPHITSANIACGLHAGDPQGMARTVRLAKQFKVAVGAHPGWPDLQGFGRREMALSPDEAEALVIYQLGALAGIAGAEGVALSHVKPHGAMYNQAAADLSLADAIARAILRFDRSLILVGLAGSALIDAGLALGLRTANEAFPDRGYHPDGTLIPRGGPGAVIQDPDEVAVRALQLAREGPSFGGRVLRADTLCLHGDHPRAAENAKRVRAMLSDNGILVEALS